MGSNIISRKKFIFFALIIGFALITYSGGKLLFNNEAIVHGVANPVQPGDEAVDGTDFVTFDSFFLADTDNDGVSEGYRTNEIEVGKSDKLYFDVKVMGDTKLKNAKITFEKNNVSVAGTVGKGSLVENTITSDNFDEIELKEINNGLSSFFYLNVTPSVGEYISKYNATNKVILTGTIENTITHEEKQIRKEVEYNVNSYATKISANVTKSNDTEVKPFAVTYNIEIRELDNQMPLYMDYMYGKISDLNGVMPTNVRIYTNTGKNTNVSYDPDTGVFSASMTATVQDGQTKNPAYTTKEYDTRITNWHIYVEYPEDMATPGTANISVTAFNQGFSNAQYNVVMSNHQSAVFSHTFFPPVTTDTGFSDNSKQQLGASISGDRYFVDKTLLMKNYHEDITEPSTFKEYWSLNSRMDENEPGRAVYEGNTLTLDSASISSVSPYVSVKHSSNLFFTNGGKLSIYDQNDNLIAVLDKNNVGEEIEFPENVTNVKIVSSHLEKYENIYASVTFTRQFNLNGFKTMFTEAELDRHKDIKNHFYAHQLYDDGTDGPEFVIRSNSVFDVKESWAKGSLDKDVYDRNTENVSIPMVYTIDFSRQSTDTTPWKEGLVVVEVSKDIIDVQDLNIITNNEVVSKEIYKQNNKNYIKLNLKTSQSSLDAVNLEFNAVVDARSSDVDDVFILYAINKENTFYRYNGADALDINGNNDNDEIINVHRTRVHIAAPHEVITGSIIKNYDAAESETISPLIADVNPLRGSKDADMEVFVINNSDNVIQDVEFIGKVGYIGNTYVGTNVDMGTEYNTQMAGPIVVPTALQGKVDIYYSTLDNPTTDTSLVANQWTQSPSDFSTVKSYLIKIDNTYNIAVGDNVAFRYPIELPENTTNLNKVSYYNHKVNFKYTTDAGTYSSSVSGSKLGIRLARKYDVTINLYKVYSDNKLSEGTYLLEDNQGNTKSVTIKPNGVGIAKDLYVDRVYTLKQITAGSENIIDTEIKHFKITNGTNDNLLLSNDGTYRSITFDNDESMLNIDLENEVLYKLDLLNVDITDQSALRNSRFVITGVNHESGTLVSTDSNGHAIVSGLLIGQPYIVQQKTVNGYAPVANFQIKIVRDPVTHEIYVTAKRIPYFTVKNCDPLFTLEPLGQTTDKQNYSIYTEPNINEQAETRSCILGLDLTKFDGDYRIAGTLGYIAKTTNMRVWFRVASGTDVTTSGTVANISPYNYSYFSSGTRSFNINQAWVDEGSGSSRVSLTGGRDYDFEIRFDRGDIGTSITDNDQLTRETWSSVNSFGIVAGDGEIEKYIVEQERSNVNVGNSENVVETLTHYDLQDATNPILNVKVQNKALEKATFEINKIDADSQEPLEGAQFKITGPGILNGFTYLTTDAQGKASIDLYKSYSGNINAVPGLNDEGYPLVNMYEIKEISAPAGYSIDNKPIVFKLDYQIIGQNDFVRKLKVDKSLDHEFAGTQVDDTNDVFKGYMEDYPSIKIIKKDAETQNLLPNTYFTISKIEEDGTLSPAKDVNNNIVGVEMLFGGQSKFVIQTDEKGEIRLNLSSGRYQLEEVIPSDDKYDLTGQVYIFSVGESIPYEPEGGSLDSGASLGQEFGTYSYNLDMLPTSDGGYLVYNHVATYNSSLSGYATKIYKYSATNELEWASEFVPNVTRIEGYTYFNDPQRFVNKTEINEKLQGQKFNVYEGDDAYYINYGHPLFYKISKSDGSLVGPQQSYTSIQRYNQLCDKVDGETYEDYVLYPDDDTKYYCGYPYSSYWNYPNSYGSNNLHSFDVNGTNAAMIYSIYSPDQYQIKLKDGSIAERDGEQPILIRFNSNGEIIRTKSFYKEFIDKINEYIDEQQIPIAHIEYNNSQYSLANNGYATSMKLLDDGSIIFVAYTNYASWIVKFDANDNVVSVRPVTVNGNSYYAYYQSSTDSTTIYIDDDGNVYMRGGGNGISFRPHTPSNLIYNDKLNYYDFGIGDDDSDTNGYYPLLKYNSDGKLLAAVELYRGRNSSDMDSSKDTNIFMINPLNVFDSGFRYFPVDDGFVVLSRIKINEPDDDATPEQLKLFYKLTLHNGTDISFESIRGKTTYSSSEPGIFMLAKYNYDSSIEWVRLYQGFSTKYGYNNSNGFGVPNVIPMKDNMFYSLIDTSADGNIQEIQYGEETDTTSNVAALNDVGLYKFFISDAIEPETPAQYKLEIFNYLKQYDINVTSNEGGSFKVTDGDDTIFEGRNPGKVETVSHGKNSVYKIKAIPDTGYSIKSIKVNGEEADYTVYDDGTVVLKKFNNVTEEKNVVVTFELGRSRVVVHHYFKGTTDQAASDELLTGLIGSDYVTAPKVSNNIELAKDDNGEFIMPDNAQGQYAVDPIVVTYYYVNKPAVIETYFYLEDSTTELATKETDTKTLGDSYETSPKDVPGYKVSRVVGKESGVLNTPLTQVYYYYDQITESHLHVHYVDKDTNNDIAQGYDEDLTVGDNYTAVPLSNIPQYYTFDSDSGNTSGPANLEHIHVYYYYTHDKSKITTKYIDAETGDKIANDNIEYINKGETYTTSPLQNPPAGYVLKQVPANASDVANDDEIDVIYYYESQKATLITKYINAETGEKLKDDYEVIKHLGDTYQTVGLDPIPDGFMFKSVDGNESGTLTSPLTVVTYYYVTDKATLTVKYLDKRTNERLKKDDVSTIKLGETYSTTGLNPIPEGYTLYEEPKNASGVANSKEITVIYYYEKGSPKTNDNIIKYIGICAISVTALAGLYLFKRKRNNK